MQSTHPTHISQDRQGREKEGGCGIKEHELRTGDCPSASSAPPSCAIWASHVTIPQVSLLVCQVRKMADPREFSQFFNCKLLCASREKKNKKPKKEIPNGSLKQVSPEPPPMAKAPYTSKKHFTFGYHPLASISEKIAKLPMDTLGAS